MRRRKRRKRRARRWCRRAVRMRANPATAAPPLCCCDPRRHQLETGGRQASAHCARCLATAAAGRNRRRPRRPGRRREGKCGTAAAAAAAAAARAYGHRPVGDPAAAGPVGLLHGGRVGWGGRVAGDAAPRHGQDAGAGIKKLALALCVCVCVLSKGAFVRFFAPAGTVPHPASACACLCASTLKLARVLPTFECLHSA